LQALQIALIFIKTYSAVRTNIWFSMAEKDLQRTPLEHNVTQHEKKVSFYITNSPIDEIKLDPKHGCPIAIE
jgi:hypothetical protein